MCNAGTWTGNPCSEQVCVVSYPLGLWALSTCTDTLSSALSQLGVWLQLTPHSWLCGDGGGPADPAAVPNASPGPPAWQDGPSEPLGHWGHLPPTCPHQSQPWGPRPTGE